jgi:hypothetical protein
MPCADYRAIWRTNRTEIALFLPAPGITRKPYNSSRPDLHAKLFAVLTLAEMILALTALAKFIPCVLALFAMSYKDRNEGRFNEAPFTKTPTHN